MDAYTNRTTVYSGPHSIIQVADDTSAPPNTPRQVAIKTIDVDFNPPPHSYQAELRILKKLQGNRRFLQLIYNEKKWDDVFIVTEFYPQYDLDKVLHGYLHKRTKFNWDDPSQNKVVTENRMPVEIIDKMFASMLQTLAVLHNDYGIIHRDIKPSNWLIGEDITSPVLGDFGISYEAGASDGPAGQKHPDEPAEPADQKHTDVATGFYKPPELCFGVRNYGYEVDVWSLAVMMTLLYSADGTVATDDGEGEPSDLLLISGIFAVLGTPSTTDAMSANYWPQIDSDEYTFNKFDFLYRPRNPPETLVPRCTNPRVVLVVDRMLVYDGTRRITSSDAVAAINSSSSSNFPDAVAAMNSSSSSNFPVTS